LCDSLNASELSQKITKFIKNKEEKDVMLESYKSTAKPQANINALENRRMMKTAMTSGDRPDISQFAINQSGNSVQVSTKSENERSRDIDDIIE